MSNFFEELKKRNVYKVATAYAVTAWLLMQVVSTLANNLGGPASIADITTRVLIVGFPIALVLTWLYEFTPKGLKRTGKIQQDTSDNRKAGRRLNRVIIGILALALCFMLVERFFFAGRTAINEKQKASIAVLPFDFQSSDNSLAFMSDALSGAISDRLGQVSGLMVTSKISSSQFKGQSRDAREIANYLDVNYLMEGDLQMENNRLRLRTRLVNASNGYVRWQKQYDQEFSTIMEVEEDIARRVVSELRVEIFPAESLQLSKKVAKNSEAYTLYLKALDLGKQRKDKPLKEAISLIEKALELEPNFAKAHAELVILYSLRYSYGEMNLDVMIEKMKYHLGKAKDIDQDLPEVHFAAARVATMVESDSDMAIDHLKKATELNPNYAEALYALSRQLARTNQEEAVKTILKAYELDPYNDFLSSMVAQTYKYVLKDEEMALKVLNKILDKDPTANFCSRIKSSFMAGAPYGDIPKAFITLHKAMQADEYEAVHLGWMITYAMDLDLVPLAERYTNLHQLKYPSRGASFHRRYQVNSFKKNYRDNIDLIKIWASEDRLPDYMETYYLAQTYLRMGKPENSKSILDAGYPELAQLIANISISDSIPYSEYTDEIDLYIDVNRVLGNKNVTKILADKSCEYYDQLIIEKSLENSYQADLYKSYCYYNQNDVRKLIEVLDKGWFKDKERSVGSGLFSEIQDGFYMPFEKEEVFIEFAKRVTEETHRMRAEVIAYLKEQGDWNDIWDKELGLE